MKQLFFAALLALLSTGPGSSLFAQSNSPDTEPKNQPQQQPCPCTQKQAEPAQTASESVDAEPVAPEPSLAPLPDPISTPSAAGMAKGPDPECGEDENGDEIPECGPDDENTPCPEECTDSEDNVTARFCNKSDSPCPDAESPCKQCDFDQDGENEECYLNKTGEATLKNACCPEFVIIPQGGMPSDEITGTACGEVNLEAHITTPNGSFGPGWPKWKVTGGPTGSNVVFDPEADPPQTPSSGTSFSFTPDGPGEYTVTCDCIDSSASATIDIGCPTVQVSVSGEDFGNVAVGIAVTSEVTASAELTCQCSETPEQYAWSVKKVERSDDGSDGSWQTSEYTPTLQNVAGSPDKKTIEATFPTAGYWRVELEANVTWKTENCEGECSGTAGTTTIAATVVGVDRVIVDGSQPENSGPVQGCIGKDIKLRAMPSPENANFPSGQPVWNVEKYFETTQQWTSYGITGTGDTITVTINEEGRYRATATCGTSEGTISINVPDMPEVGVVADTHAVEGGVDNITIRFVRFADDVSHDLEVKFNQTFAQADFENDADFQKISSGAVTIPAGANSSDLYTLKAVADQVNGEGIETFSLTVTDTQCYDVLPEPEEKKKKDSQDAYGFQYFYVLECTTLYAVGGNDVPIDAGNPGIHITDINQGGVGDCFCMAAMGAVVEECWEIIQSRITDNGNGSYSVTLWDGDEWKTYQVSSSLDRGWDAAQLSGDLDANGCAEVWPIVLEDAYAQMVGGFDQINQGGQAPDVYEALTGSSNNQTIITNGMTADEIVIAINNARGQGKQVVLATKDNIDAGITNMTNPPVATNHAYVVVGADSANVTLDNPWGANNNAANVDVPIDLLDDITEAIYILDNVGCP